MKLITPRTSLLQEVWVAISEADYAPNPKPSGAIKGRTGPLSTSVALHFTTVSGHVGRGQGAGVGQVAGGGHFTSGHRGRGQGGHSPHLAPESALVSIIIGCAGGILLLRTYCDKSGTGGHSVLSIYILISGPDWKPSFLLTIRYVIMHPTRRESMQCISVRRMMGPI